MKSTTAIFLILAFGAHAAFAAPFWPTDLDATYLYENDEGQFLEITFSSNGDVVSRYIGDLVDRVSETYVEDDEGNVFMTFSMLYVEGAIDPDYWYYFDPGLQIVSGSIAVGDSWASFSAGHGGYSPNCYTSWAFDVVAETEVTVPAGTFSAFEVSFSSQSCLVYPQNGIWYLNAELGPVVVPGGYKLVSHSHPVAVEDMAWDSLKALFR